MELLSARSALMAQILQLDLLQKMTVNAVSEIKMPVACMIDLSPLQNIFIATKTT